MKKVLLLLSLLMTAPLLRGSGFVPIPANDTILVGSQYDKYLNIPIQSLFQYPDSLDTTKDPASLGITVEGQTTNPALTSFYKAQAGYKGATVSFKVTQESYGQSDLTVTMGYEGDTTSNTIHLTVLPMKGSKLCQHVKLGEVSSLDLLPKWQFYKSAALDSATITILSVTRGTAKAVIGEKGHQVIEYTPAQDTESNYRDQISYTVTLPDSSSESEVIDILAHGNIYASRVIEFVPAPGQFTNTVTADPEAKGALGNFGIDDATTPRSSGLVSLGSFGGYVVLGFDQPIKNDPMNRYGVDFSIMGNAFAGSLKGVWTEPGAVQVMKDINGDGVPNDGDWYELAGSDYWLNSSKRNIAMTYFNPGYTMRHTVPWTTNDGESGAVLTNNFHAQAYYPDPEKYPVGVKQHTYHGTLIKSSADRRAPAYIEFYRSPGFGYADNHGVQTGADPTSPNNPYYPDENGKVMDGMDISWAVDSTGQYVDLDQIDFVRIYCAGAMNGGWVGEWSTEVAGVVITIPENDSYVPQDHYLNYIGINQLQVPVGQKCQYQGLLFKNGRLCHEGTPRFWVENDSIGTIDSDGWFTALNEGKTQIYFQQYEDADPDMVDVVVDRLVSLIVDQTGNAQNKATEIINMVAGDKEYINVESVDNVTQKVNGKYSNRFLYDTYTWTSSNPASGTIDNGIFTALQPDTVVVTATSVLDPSLSTSVKIVIAPAQEPSLITSSLVIPDSVPQMTYNADDLFNKMDDKSTIFFDQVDDLSCSSSIQGSKLLCSFDQEGTYPITLTVSNHGFSYTYDLSLVYGNPDPDTGVEQLRDDSTMAQTSYFDLMGRKVANPSHGIYLRVRDGKVQKIIL